MKVSVAALAVLLLMALFSLAGAGAQAVDAPHCCNEYFKKPFRAQIVKSFFRTDGSCRQPAVVFLLKKGRSACVDPNDSWVINLIELINKRPRH